MSCSVATEPGRIYQDKLVQKSSSLIHLIKDLITRYSTRFLTVSRDTQEKLKKHYFITLTHYNRLFMDLLRQVGPFGQAVQVPLQDIPAYLIVEGETELGMNLKTGTKLASVQQLILTCTLVI